MKNILWISAAMASTIIVTGCAPISTSGELSNTEIRGICYRMADAVRSQNRMKKQLNSAELYLARIRADVLRGEKRSPLAKAMAAHGLQNNQLSAAGWAEGMLGNEDIEETAKNEVWFVEVRQAKEKYEELEARLAASESKWTRGQRRLRENDFNYDKCLGRGWY